MFDRYAGDNRTQLPSPDRMYLDSKQGLVVPAINIFSLLCAENTKSVARQFFGRAGKTVALGIAGYCGIEPFDVPLLDETGRQIKWTGEWTDKIFMHEAVARVKGGIPNPKQRPTVNTPWALEFNVEFIENESCSVATLKQAFDMGGSIGLGTFRPFFGRYRLAKFE